MKKNLLITIGILIYVILAIVDRVIIKIPDYIYIPVAILEFILLIIGIKKVTKKPHQVVWLKF
jgi:hypothetical protein